MSLRIILILTVVMVCSCNQDSSKRNKGQSDRHGPLVIQELKLPLNHHLNGNTEFSNISLDSFPPYWFEPVTILGKLPENENYVGFVTHVLGGDYSILAVETFEKSGKPIDKQQLSSTSCGSGAGCGVKCEEWLSIAPNFTIKNEVKNWISECKDDHPVEGTEKFQSEIRVGKLLESGKVNWEKN